MQFKWADSETVYDEMEDFYCDGDAAPLGRMNFVYQNHIPGVSEIKYPWDTEAPTEAPTEPITEAPTEVPTEAPTEAPTDASATEAPTVPETAEPPEKGCASSVAAGMAVLTAMAAAVALRKKKGQV